MSTNNPLPEAREETINVVHRDRSRSTGRARFGRAGAGYRNYGQRLACYICGNIEHLQRRCPSQYCQLCGKKGHDRRDCYNKKQVMSLDCRAGASCEGEGMDQAGVMIPIKLNGIKIGVMLDSGEQPSIIDTASLHGLGVDFTVHPSRVHGVCAMPIKSRGYVDLEVNIGKSAPMKHRFMVLDSAEPTLILGRDYLRRFNSTEFDWQNHRV